MLVRLEAGRTIRILAGRCTSLMAMMASFSHTAFGWAHTDYWLEYVPSKANIADGPSRHFYDHVHELCGVDVTTALQ